MAPPTFSTLPAEIHVSIADHCENNDLINLCLTSKLLNERCLRVLYRHVHLVSNQPDLSLTTSQDYSPALDAVRKRQQQFVYTLLSKPEYGKHVRYFKSTLWIPSLNKRHSLREATISDEELWRAMHSLTHVQSVEIASRTDINYSLPVPRNQLQNDLFRSATSVRLVGSMQYSLAKSILNAINPATLKHLCLDRVQDVFRVGPVVPGNRGDGRMIALGVASGLLTTLTGHCTGLRTLILRRLGQGENFHRWHAAAEEASYTEWASFIRSVQGTVEKFKFEQFEYSFIGFSEGIGPSRIMNERFERLILPALVAGNWPCLKTIQLRGIRGQNGQGSSGKVALTTELRAALGANPEIVVEEEFPHTPATLEPDGWN